MVDVINPVVVPSSLSGVADIIARAAAQQRSIRAEREQQERSISAIGKERESERALDEKKLAQQQMQSRVSTVQLLAQIEDPQLRQGILQQIVNLDPGFASLAGAVGGAAPFPSSMPAQETTLESQRRRGGEQVLRGGELAIKGKEQELDKGTREISLLDQQLESVELAQKREKLGYRQALAGLAGADNAPLPPHQVEALMRNPMDPNVDVRIPNEAVQQINAMAEMATELGLWTDENKARRSLVLLHSIYPAMKQLELTDANVEHLKALALQAGVDAPETPQQGDLKTLADVLVSELGKFGGVTIENAKRAKVNAKGEPIIGFWGPKTKGLKIPEDQNRLVTDTDVRQLIQGGDLATDPTSAEGTMEIREAVEQIITARDPSLKPGQLAQLDLRFDFVNAKGRKDDESWNLDKFVDEIRASRINYRSAITRMRQRDTGGVNIGVPVQDRGVSSMKRGSSSMSAPGVEGEGLMSVDPLDEWMRLHGGADLMRALER